MGTRWNGHSYGFGIGYGTSIYNDYDIWISSSGNLGIGTGNPGYKLEVNGDFKTDNFEVTGSGSASGDIIISSAYMAQNVATSNMNGKNCNVIFRRRANGGTNDFYKIRVSNSDGTAKTFLYAFKQDTNNASSGLNDDPYSIIDANNNVSFSGKVGIGDFTLNGDEQSHITATPLVPLHIKKGVDFVANNILLRDII